MGSYEFPRHGDAERLLVGERQHHRQRRQPREWRRDLEQRHARRCGSRRSAGTYSATLPTTSSVRRMRKNGTAQQVPVHLTRPLQDPTLVITGDRWAAEGLEVGAELWRVPFAGWGEPHELRADAPCIPRRFTVIDSGGLVRASGYTAKPTCLPGEPFALRVASPLAASPVQAASGDERGRRRRATSVDRPRPFGEHASMSAEDSSVQEWIAALDERVNDFVRSRQSVLAPVVYVTLTDGRRFIAAGLKPGTRTGLCHHRCGGPGSRHGYTGACEGRVACPRRLRAVLLNVGDQARHLRAPRGRSHARAAPYCVGRT